MTKRVAVNGFGRIGRLVFRHLMNTEGLEVVAINDIAPLENLAYLLKYDSVHTDPDVLAVAGDGVLMWGEDSSVQIMFTSEREPKKLPWKKLDVDIVVEASGVFTNSDAASGHLKAGAQKVIITAPAKGEVATVCMGINEDTLDPAKDKIISNASCTTNCLAPVAKVLDEEFGIVTGFLTTVHASTASQSVVDQPSKKMRRGRSALVNLIPTTTGAAIATTKVLPQLKGKMDGMAIRVPVADGSIVDFVATLNNKANVESVNQAFKDAARSDRLHGILGYTDEELVSQDVVGSTYSSLVDGLSTMMVGDKTVKVLSWYDNEWGYSRRIADLTYYAANLG